MLHMVQLYGARAVTRLVSILHPGVALRLLHGSWRGGRKITGLTAASGRQGVMAQLFCDFGEHFDVSDTNGEAPQQGIVCNISAASEA
eukprot:SAG11_NODE_25816_length_353_cov_1.224409_1_plen_87_part_10